MIESNTRGAAQAEVMVPDQVVRVTAWAR